MIELLLVTQKCTIIWIKSFWRHVFLEYKSYLVWAKISAISFSNCFIVFFTFAFHSTFPGSCFYSKQLLVSWIITDVCILKNWFLLWDKNLLCLEDCATLLKLGSKVGFLLIFFLRQSIKLFFFEISWALHFLTGVKSKVKDTKNPSLFIRICATLYLLMGFMGKKTNQYLWEKLIEIFSKDNYLKVTGLSR